MSAVHCSSAEGEAGAVRYRYDGGGKLIEQYDEGAGEKTEYRYDRAGNRVRMLNGNRDVRYTYGRNNELLSVADNSQRLRADYQYDANGREVLRAYGNGVRQETRYDKAGRAILIRELDSGNGLIRAEGYLYDGAGRRSHSVDGEGKLTKYIYDAQSRLQIVLYPWTEEKAASDREEAEEAGLYFTADKGAGERYTLEAEELARLRAVLNLAGLGRGNAVGGSQLVWRESYAYDGNGNRVRKATPWGTIAYTYDAENRLIKKGDIVYTYDRDGNLLSEKGLRREAEYRYNGQNRMAYSEVTSHTERSRVAGEYGYDALGRRTLARDAGGGTMRALYDGTGFEVIREGAAFRDGRFTTRYSEGIQAQANPGTEGSRYRWVGDGAGDARTRTTEGEYGVVQGRYTGVSVTLYGRGEAVAVSRSASTGSRGGPAYLGKDILGSVRSATNEYGSLEDRYEYDAFGKPYRGDLSAGMNLGYTGKPYDTTTGLYNYGYRDYAPEAARFTTADPVRDGSNWFAYVNNDPVNFLDLLGLADIVVWSAIDRHDGINNAAYNLLVHDSYSKIKKAAKETGQSIEIIKGKNATGAALNNALNSDAKNVIVVAHGTPGGGIQDQKGALVRINRPASNIQSVDIVACYASDRIFPQDTPTSYRTYNPRDPADVIYWNQTNDVLDRLLPDSIKNGTDNSGPPTKEPGFFTRLFARITGGSGANKNY